MVTEKFTAVDGHKPAFNHPEKIKIVRMYGLKHTHVHLTL